MPDGPDWPVPPEELDEKVPGPEVFAKAPPAPVMARLIAGVVDSMCVSGIIRVLVTTAKDVPAIQLFGPFVVVLVYYVAQEAMTGQTLGKRVANTRVVDADGRSIGPGRAVARTLLRMIPLEAVTILFTRRALHDSLSGTRVVSDAPLTVG